ncbi:unnamed protein product, partial [Rotaria sp. Silwood2]
MSQTSDFNIRSIELYPRDGGAFSSDDERGDITDISLVPEISAVKRNEDKFYQQLLPIDDGIYDGTINEKMLREGFGTFSSNNGERYYSGVWKDDKPRGYGYRFDKFGSAIYYGEFNDKVLQEGYGKLRLDNGYSYEGKMKNDQFHGLGSLSIEIDGLKEIDSPGTEKDTLKLVAEWENGKTKIIYTNEIKEYYKYQYKVFSNSIESMSSFNSENQQNQRKYFQNLIDLLNESYSNIDLLREIASPNCVFPVQLKSSAHLLTKLDNSYSSLKEYTEIDEKESYKESAKRLCQHGLKLYARRLAWTDNDDKFYDISSKIIFDKSLDTFANKASLSDLKEVLLINPLIIDLIHKMIRYANEKLIQVPLQYRSFFINTHNTLIKNIWMDYFEKFKDYPESNLPYNVVNNAYHFYADCYSNLIELSLVNEFQIEINIQKPTNNILQIKVNKDIVFDYTTECPNQSLILIVLHGATGMKKLDRIPTINPDYNQLNEMLNSSEIDDNDIIIFSLLNYSMDNLDIEYKNIFKKIGSTEIENAIGKIYWIFIGKKIANGKLNERIISDKKDQLVIKQNVRLEIREKSKIEAHNIKSQIESIIFKTMMFSLNYLKPWENLSTKDLSSYFNQSIQKNASTKEIGDHLLMKILENIKNEIKQFFKENNNNSTDTFISLISYYQDSLLKDENLNYQSKMKGIMKIIDYLLQISLIENYSIRSMIDLQLKTMKIFIEAKETITEIIDHFLGLNEELLKLILIFDTHFSSSIHEKFHKKASEIISMIQEILKVILEEQKNVISQLDLFKKYQVSDLETALQAAVSHGNIYDVEVLLDLGANINTRFSSSEETPIQCTVIANDKNLVSHLLERGADIEIKDKKQMNAIDYAKQHGDDLVSYKKQIENRKKGISKQVEIQLYALQKMNDFLTNLRSLDFTWYIEHREINPLHFQLFKEVSNKVLYKALNISAAKSSVKEPCTHYVLEAIAELLDIVKNIPNFDRVSPMEMLQVKAELLVAIGKSFKYFTDQIKYNELSKFKEDCVKPFRDVIINNDSYEAFCIRLEKIGLYFLYNRKLKEITLDRALTLFRKENGDGFNFDKIGEAFKNYEKSFENIFSDIINKHKTVTDIVNKTRKLAEESKLKRSVIPGIIAGLSVILSLTVSDFIEKNHKGEYILKSKFNKNYLLQPHCIQILGVLILLGIDENSNTIPVKHIAEILTGQGKSWALCLLAGYFSLTGYRVTVACYSTYLTERDAAEFKKNFDPFNFTNPIEYETLELMCRRELNSGDQKKSLGSLVLDLISGNDLSSTYSQHNEKKNS